MKRQAKQPVQRYHDRVAGRYDDIYDDAYWQWHDTLTWDHLKPFLPRDAARPLLDLGCGTGKWAMKLLKSGFAVTSVDISAAMVERCRRKIEDAGLQKRADFLHADLVDLSALPRQTFALAVAFGDPIGCATDPGKALKEIRRCLCDDGVLVATFDNRWATLDFLLEKGDAAEMKHFLAKGSTHWLTADKAEQFPIHTYAPTQLAALLERSGFEMVDLIGKTVLPMRRRRTLLASPADRRAWLAIEKRLWRDPAAIGRAAHLQVAARVARTS